MHQEPAVAAIVPMQATAHELARYADIVCAGMSPDDVHDRCELAELLGDGRLMAWWTIVDGEVVDWCALAPNHGESLPGCWHLYGSWVRPDMRGRGLGRAMWNHRIALIPSNAPITVSIQPEKVESLGLARSFGFQEIAAEPPWRTFALSGDQAAK